MKKILFVVFLMFTQFVSSAQQVLSTYLFDRMYTNFYMRPQFMSVANYEDSKYIYLLESTGNQQFISRIIKNNGNNEQSIYTNTQLMRQVVPLQNRAVMAMQSLNGRACSLAIHFFDSDSIISIPLNLQASNMIFDVRGLCILDDSVGALLLKVTSTAPNLGDVVYLFNTNTGAYINHFSLNTTSNISTFKIEPEFNSTNLKVYHINRSEIYVDRLSINGGLLNRSLILRHPRNLFFDYFSTTLFETPTPNAYYCVFNGNTPGSFATSYIVNGQINWTNTGSLMWTGDFVNHSQDVFLRFDSVVVANRMRYHYIKRISNTNRVVWQSLIDSTSIANDLEAVSNIPLAASVMSDSTLLVAGVKVLTLSFFVNPAIPYLLEISNAGQPWRPGMVVSSNERQKLLSYALYPNPAAKRVKLLFNVEEVKSPLLAEVYSLTGSKIQSYPLLSNETELDISGLASGVYLVKVAGAETKKLVVTE